VAIATSPATMAYMTTETGVVTMIILVLVAEYLLTRRAAGFAKPEGRVRRSFHTPSPRPTNKPRRRAGTLGSGVRLRWCRAFGDHDRPGPGCLPG
jgi:hypothetical protein